MSWTSRHLRHLAVGLIACLAGPTLAETCTFTQECFETDGCTETGFTLSIEDDQIITDAETIPGTDTEIDTARVFFGQTDSAAHLLSRTENGAARYSTHILGVPLMVNYVGECAS